MNYSIRDLEIISGIKAHTIRIWEKRYALLEPMRTETNIRLYSEADMRLLLNVALLNKHGFKISNIQEMSKNEINQKVISLESSSVANDLHINNLILAMMAFDETQFEHIIDTCAETLGFEYIVESLMLGFFKRIGLMWQIGEITPAKEHFVTNIFRHKIISSLDNVSISSKGGKTFLMFLPEGENHEIALLFIKYILRKNGHNIIYLGQNVPVQSLNEVLTQKHIDYLVVSLTTPLEDVTYSQFVQEVESIGNFTSILIGGNLSEKQKQSLPPIFHFFDSIESIRGFIENLK